MSKSNDVMEKTRSWKGTRACKRLIFAVSRHTRELISGHVTRENRIYAGEILHDVSSSGDPACQTSCRCSAPYCFDTAPY
jgi:hypothetical protein